MDYNQMLQIFYVWTQVINLCKNQMGGNQIDLGLVFSLSKENHKFYWKYFSQTFFQKLVKEKLVVKVLVVIHHISYHSNGISSWPWALFIFRVLIILRNWPSLKSRDSSFAWVTNNWLVGSILLFFIGVHWSPKNLLKVFAFACISVTHLSSIKRGGIRGIFVKCFKNWPIGFCLQQ